MTVGRALTLVALVAATTLTFWPAVEHGFLNWDDAETLVGNEALRRPPGALVAWAFSTTHMGHYQPLSWLAVAWLGGDPVDPARVHLLALCLHALTVGLLFVAAVRFAERTSLDEAASLPAAAAVALFAVHPLRVEPVAWASALPYLLSAAPLVAAVACWTTWTRRGGAGWWWATLAAYAVSQLARVTAPLLPLVLVLLARADPRARPLELAGLGRAVAPLAVVAAVLTIAEAWARDAASLGEVGLLPRLASAMAQPALYLWRTMAPLSLNPLDVLPREGQADWGAAALGTIALTVVVLGTRQLAGSRVSAAIWGSYMALLAPFLGLLASGVQATADRYTYLAAMVLSTTLAVALVRAPRGLRQGVLVVAGAAAVASAAASRTQLEWWRDSVSLWSRAADLDEQNDIALYNLAIAQADAADPQRAEATLQRVVAVVPDHGPARRLLATIAGDREQASGDAAAAAGRFFEAIAAYDRALAADPDRTRARLTRGMALVRAGQWTRAAADLEAAGAPAAEDPAVVSALALAWAETGRSAEAIRLLRTRRQRRPQDPGLTMNLARLLLAAPSTYGGDVAEALALAAALNDATGGNQPQVLATLAEALSRSGRAQAAAEAWTAAVAFADAAGDADLAAALRERARRTP